MDQMGNAECGMGPHPCECGMGNAECGMWKSPPHPGPLPFGRGEGELSAALHQIASGGLWTSSFRLSAAN